jgi:hypothetical protein
MASPLVWDDIGWRRGLCGIDVDISRRGGALVQDTGSGFAADRAGDGVGVHEDILDSLTAKVRTVMQGRQSFETSQVRIIGLEQIKQVAGSDWALFATRVRTYSRYFIERRLEANDVVIPCGDGFVVIYDSCEHAEQKSAALQRALNIFYLGEEGMEGIRAEVRSQLVPVVHLLNALSKTVASEALPAAPVAVAESSVRPREAFKTSLSVLPVWSVMQGAVTGYWISPAQRVSGLTHYGYDLGWRASGQPSSEDFLALDLSILAQAVASLTQGQAAGRPALICYSVHASTMRRREQRQAFLQQLHAIPEHLRANLLGRIAEISPGTPKSTIADWVHQLRPVSQRVVIELHPHERLAGGWKDVGIIGVACVAPPIPPVDRYTDRYVHLIKTWAPILKREGLAFRMDNINSTTLLACAVEHGVDRCSSELLWPPVAEPLGIRPYSLAQFRASIRANEDRAMLSA